jgi:uncharacterized protein YjeT (DUF2065 family)
MTLGAGEIAVAVGLMLVVEGLVLALAPSRIEEVLDFLRRLSVENRRTLGLLAVAAGVLTIWLAGGVRG